MGPQHAWASPNTCFRTPGARPWPMATKDSHHIPTSQSQPWQKVGIQRFQAERQKIIFRPKRAPSMRGQAPIPVFAPLGPGPGQWPPKIRITSQLRKASPGRKSEFRDFRQNGKKSFFGLSGPPACVGKPQYLFSHPWGQALANGHQRFSSHPNFGEPALPKVSV